jgi:RIO-like serine/threonine protein kinase
LNTVNRNTELIKNEASCTVQLHHARNKTKAEVYIADRNGSKIVLKDFQKVPMLIRLFYGRYSLNREAKSYAWLEGVSGIPQCFGFEGRDVLLLEHVKGQPLSRFKRGKVPESVFVKLGKIISSIHSRGVANGDLHRSNVLLTSDWDVYLVDFASAFFTDNADKPGFLFRGIKNLDLHALERMKAKYLCLEKPVPKGFFGFCYNFCVSGKKVIKKIKKYLSNNKK